MRNSYNWLSLSDDNMIQDMFVDMDRKKQYDMFNTNKLEKGMSQLVNSMWEFKMCLLLFI